MKRALLLTFVLAAALWAGAFDPGAAQASSTCTTTCPSGVTLKCCVATGTCTSSASGLDCAGVSHTCADYDAGAAARTNCLGNCFDSYEACVDSCTTFTCVNQCVQVRNYCNSHCPAAPATTWGC